MPRTSVFRAREGRALRSPRYDKALVVPPRDNRAGVFVDGALVDDCLLSRRFFNQKSGQIIKAAPYPNGQDFPRLEQHVIFGGYNWYHFGHFLLETLSRVWYIKQNPDVPVLWFRGQQFNERQLQIFSLLGVENEFLYIQEPTIVRSIVIPEPGYVCQHDFAPEQEEALAVFEAEPVESGKRVWLSRSQLNNHGGLLNEEALEFHLGAAGWTIFHPEQHCIEDQLREITSAEHVAGIQGSAFHLFILARHVRTRVTILDARGARIANYDTIARRKSIRQDIVPLETVQASPGIPVETKWILPNFAGVLDRLGVERGPGGGGRHERPGWPLVSAIVEAVGAESYLESIGLACIQFAAVAAARRVYLADRFHFDYREFESETARFYEMKSEAFWALFGCGRTFDVIHLRNAGSFEKMLRDFCASLTCSHPGTVWIIEGTYPTDVYAALPTRADANRFRRDFAAGPLHTPWKGDVYKMVVALHDVFPTLDYATVVDGDQSATVVWRGRRACTEPRMRDVESLCRLSFFDYRALEDVIRRCPREEALRRLLSARGAATPDSD